MRTIRPLAKDEYKNRKSKHPPQPLQGSNEIRVGYYFSSGLQLKKAREVGHYGEEFLDLIFKRHHF